MKNALSSDIVSIIKVFLESQGWRLTTLYLIIKMGGGGAPSSRFKLPDNLVFYKIFTSPFHNSYCLLPNEIISSEYPMYLNSVESDITKKNQGELWRAHFVAVHISLYPGRWEKVWTQCFAGVKWNPHPQYQIWWQDITPFKCREKITLNKICGSSGLYKFKKFFNLFWKTVSLTKENQLYTRILKTLRLKYNKSKKIYLDTNARTVFLWKSLSRNFSN